MPDRAGSRLGTRAGHGTRPSCPSRHSPRPIPDAPTSCLLPKSWRRAVYCRRSDRHWAHTVPPTTSQNRVMSLIWPQFSPCAYAPQTRAQALSNIVAGNYAATTAGQPLAAQFDAISAKGDAINAAIHAYSIAVPAASSLTIFRNSVRIRMVRSLAWRRTESTSRKL